MEGFVVMFKVLVNKLKKTFLQTEKKQIQVLHDSGLFNATFYHEHNQDVSLEESLIPSTTHSSAAFNNKSPTSHCGTNPETVSFNISLIPSKSSFSILTVN